MSCQCVNVASSTKPNRPERDQRLRARVGELLLGADDPAEPAHPRDPLVAEVPDQREPAAGLAAPARSRAARRRGRTSGRPGRRPPRRPTGRRRGAPRRRRRRCGCRGGCSRRTSSICLVGVGGVHVVAEGDQLLGELAGAGAELEHGHAASRADQPRGRLARDTTGGRGRRRRPRRRRSARSVGAARQSIVCRLPARPAARPGIACPCR